MSLPRERLANFAKWLDTTHGAIVSSLSFAYQNETWADDGMTFEDAVKMLAEDIRTLLAKEPTP